MFLRFGSWWMVPGRDRLQLPRIQDCLRYYRSGAHSYDGASQAAFRSDWDQLYFDMIIIFSKAAHVLEFMKSPEIATPVNSSDAVANLQEMISLPG